MQRPRPGAPSILTPAFTMPDTPRKVAAVPPARTDEAANTGLENDGPPAARRTRLWPGPIWLLAAVAVMSGSTWLRFEWIEPLSMAARCAASPQAWPCELRASIVMLIQHERLGWIALAVVIAGLLLRLASMRAAAYAFNGAGFLVGAAALMLYSVEPGAVAVLLASLLLLRPGAARWRAHSG